MKKIISNHCSLRFSSVSFDSFIGVTNQVVISSLQLFDLLLLRRIVVFKRIEAFYLIALFLINYNNSSL